MKQSDVVSELGVKMEEPQSQRDRRVEELWKKLDPAGHGELDFKGLQRGLKRIDHRKISCLRGFGILLLMRFPLQL
jgi:solute carrier family 25 phosphate transporter 23/24/25/41